MSAGDRRGTTESAGEKEGGKRKVVYCIVPRDLARKLHEHLRSHWREEESIRVVVERRGDERRADERRVSEAESPGSERRTIRSPTGRRIAERRAIGVVSNPPALPRRARAYAERLVFVERIEPSEQALIDAEANRLVIRVQSGDEEAMKEIYLRNFDQIYGYARLALRDRHDAEDVAQQVFMKLIQAIPRYEVRPSSPFRTWIFHIARNEIAQSFRGRLRLTFEEPHKLDMRRDEAASQEVQTMLEWLSDNELSLFIERLPENQREVLVMRYMLDLTVHEVAAVTARTSKSVRRLQERAFVTLEERLVAIGRRPERRGRRSPMLIRLKPIPVMTARRFALASSRRTDYGRRGAWGG